MASALGGVLGTSFAVALGIQRKDPQTDVSQLRLGETLIGTASKDEKGPSDALATVALFVYAAVGVAALVTVLFKSEPSRPWRRRSGGWC